MTYGKSNALVARQLITDNLNELDNLIAAGRHEWTRIHMTGEAARILGADDLVARAEALLAQLPAESYWAGAISNRPLPTTIPAEARSIATFTTLEGKYPEYSKQQLLARLARDNQLVRLCLERSYQMAMVEAHQCELNPEMAIEMIADTQAVIGDFNAALDFIQNRVNPAYRQHNARIVLWIELWRHGDPEQANSVFAVLNSEGLDTWDRAQMALALLGREPWPDYPFSDW